MLRLERKKTVPPVPLHNTTKAEGALTLHTGVRNRRMEFTDKKNARYIMAGFPTFVICYALQIYKHFYKKQISPQKLTAKIIRYSIFYIYATQYIITLHLKREIHFGNSDTGLP